MAKYKIYNESGWTEYQFDPASHNHNATDINAGTLGVDIIPPLPQSKITNLTTDLAGKAATSHTHETTALREPDYIKGNISIVAKPLFDVIRGDRTAFLPATQIIIEQSIDAGVTWTDAGISDSNKRKLFTGQRPSIGIPLKAGVKSTDCMLRITITGMRYNVPSGTAEIDKYAYWNSGYVLSTERYFAPENGWVWVTGNSDAIHLKVERATGATPNTWVTDREAYLSGWSGGNYFKLSSNFGGGTGQTSNSWNWRFTFRTVPHTHNINDAELSATYTTNAQAIHHLKISGQNVWTSSNNYMYHEHLYKWDEEQNALFPASIKSNGKLVVLDDDSRLTNARKNPYAVTIQRNSVTVGTYDGSSAQTINITDSDLDTKNTAGATNTSSKIFLVGATTQGANPQTYTHDTAYIGTDGKLYSASTEVSVVGHNHGNLSSAGLLTNTPSGVDIYSNLAITYNGKLQRSNIIFGAEPGRFLSNDGSWATPPDTKYAQAKSTTLGLIKVHTQANTQAAQTVPAEASKTAARQYSIQLDTSGNASVYVPWTIPTVPSFEATAANIKMNGTQSVGTSSKVPRADHVHPTDTSREPANANIQSHVTSPHAPSEAQVNVLEGVQVAGADLTVSNKKVNIPYAGASTPGVVKISVSGTTVNIITQ